MNKVHLLDKKVYELIAAGEVIERPSSIIKELTENSIDSGASSITVEIKQGGISYMRISDNGSGIYKDDVPTAFLRHATSKISDESDLSAISTLGFRGEALASVAAVSKVEVLTKTAEDFYGTHYRIEGTEEKLREDCGCPDGTTIIVRDLFYNVPARLKFLKKDVAEGNDIAHIVERIALSHPEISVKFIRDNKRVLFTPGDNNLYSAIYSVFGKQFAISMIPTDYSYNNIKVTGFTVKPVFGMKNRKYQTFFVNKRYIRSAACIQALEEGYKNTMMEGKFPACVLFIEISPKEMDVNVHPQKLDVRFSDEKAVYDAVYFAVRNSVLADNKPREVQINKPKPDYSLPKFTDTPFKQTAFDDKERGFERISAKDYAAAVSLSDRKTENVSPVSEKEKWENISAEEYRQKYVGNFEERSALISAAPTETTCDSSEEENLIDDDFPDFKENKESGISQTQRSYKYLTRESFEKASEEEKPPEEEIKEIPRFKITGEIFKTYIVAETDDGIIFVDKHAAHERINFERLRSGELKLRCQMLLEKAEVRLSYDEYDAVCRSLDTVKELGFDIEPLDSPIIRVNGIPSVLDFCCAADIAAELAKGLTENKHSPMPDILDDMLHSIACKASVKANDDNSPEELEVLVKRVLSDDKIKYCPHGRPVMFKITKREIEKQFRRIV